MSCRHTSSLCLRLECKCNKHFIFLSFLFHFFFSILCCYQFLVCLYCCNVWSIFLSFCVFSTTGTVAEVAGQKSQLWISYSLGSFVDIFKLRTLWGHLNEIVIVLKTCFLCVIYLLSVNFFQQYYPLS